VATIPAGVDEIILRCMAKRPEDRYQSMAELADAIRRVPAVVLPTMGEPAPVVEVTAVGPDAWARPPELEIPLVEPAHRLVATERLGSGSGDVLAASGTARGPGTWGAAPAVTARTPPPHETLEQSRTHKIPTRVPYRAFFVLGFGLGIVAACALAFMAVTHYERERDAPSDMATDQIVEDEPAAVETPKKPVGEREGAPPRAEPARPEPTPPTDAVADAPDADTAAADADAAEPAVDTADPSEPATTPRTRKKRRELTHATADQRAKPTKTEPRPDKRKPDPPDDVHPDLREPY
jgi:serine/threonine-protein kinase